MNPGDAQASFDAARCPLCHQPNECQRCTDAAFKGPCWCERLVFPGGLLEQVPAELRNRACICAQCIESFRLQQAKAKTRDAFTLLELLVVVVVMGILAALLLPALARGKLSAQSAQCVNNLRELGIASELYWNDNKGNAFSYVFAPTNYGAVYWFGWIGPGTEGQRAFNLSDGALFPYLNGSDVRLCPALGTALAQFQLKATNIVFSYGCNFYIFPTPGKPPVNVCGFRQPSQTALIADTAQINNFQTAQLVLHPLLEEFYYFDLETNYSSPDNYPNGHFRHAERANVVFCDGHVGLEKFVPGSIDPILPSQCVGQLRPEIVALP